MKISIWFNTIAVGLTSLMVCFTAKSSAQFFHDMLGGKPLPLATQFLLNHHCWMLAFPTLWVIAAIGMSFGKGVATPDRCLAFAGVSTCTIVFLMTFAALALSLPFFMPTCTFSSASASL